MHSRHQCTPDINEDICRLEVRVNEAVSEVCVISRPCIGSDHVKLIFSKSDHDSFRTVIPRPNRADRTGGAVRAFLCILELLPKMSPVLYKLLSFA